MKSAFTELKISSFHPSRNSIALGADSKNTVSIVDKKKTMVSFSDSHGSLSDPEAAAKFEKTVLALTKTAKPKILAVDLHPDYYSTVHGEKIAANLGIPVLRIQHHHAHAVSCMAEYGLDESLALVFDGTGYGTDGNLWGAEFLHVNSEGFKRLATFAAAPLPGGDVSVREPSRQFIGRMFFSAYSDKTLLKTICRKYDIDYEHAKMWIEQAEKNINCPYSHSAGRLFDSVSVLLGCAPKIAREAEAAINLQKAAESCKDNPDPSLMPFKSFEKDGILLIDWSPTFSNHSINFSKRNLLALSFHHSLAQAALQMMEFGIAKFATRNIVLSGGVFMNKLLLEILKPKLGKLKVFSQAKTPTNDCGISIGQAVIAATGNLTERAR
jgi:hydrogenase maturation protein HypF